VDPSLANVDGLLVRDPLCNSASYAQHAECSDKWNNAKSRDDRAVDDANQAANNHAHDHRKQGIDAGVYAQCRNHACQRDRRADREIDSAADDHDRHSDSAYRNDHGLRENYSYIKWREKFFGTSGNYRKEQYDCDQAQERTRPREQTARREMR